MVKKIGKAKLRVEDELWGVEGRSEKEKYEIDRRLIEKQPEVKVLKSRYTKIATKRSPSHKKIEKREAYFTERDQTRDELKAGVIKAFEGIREESFNYPIIMRRQPDPDFRGEWRFCLYKGVIYQLDRMGYSLDAIAEQIETYETAREKSARR
jgi:hypothetical protein